MLSFYLLRYRVTVHPSFWLMGALLGLGTLEGPKGHPVKLMLWILIMFLSILWHELGHAIAFRRCRMESEIVLYSMGGYAAPLAPGHLTRNQDIFVSLAGPLMQLAVGIPLYLVSRWGYFDSFLVGREFAHDALVMVIWINIFWALVNLLPVLPLDGGRISRALCGPRNLRTALWISVIAGAAAAVGMLMLGMPYGGLFFGLLAFNNWQQLNGTGSSDR